MDPNNKQHIPLVDPGPANAYKPVWHNLVLVLVGALLLAIGALGGYIFANISNKDNVVKNNNTRNITTNKTSKPDKKTTPIPEMTQNIDELVTYTTPKSWKRSESNGSISFQSSDMKTDAAGYLDQGAILYLTNLLNIEGLLLKDYITRHTPDGVSVLRLPFRLGSLSGINAFYCWESCVDEYYVAKGEYVWRITFSCAPGCDTKEKIDANRYAKERDEFIASLQFKETSQ